MLVAYIKGPENPVARVYTYRIPKFVVQSFGLDSVLLTEGSIWISVMRSGSGSNFANNYTGPRLSSSGRAFER